MRKYIIIISFITAALISFIALESAHCYWIWTPETKKFINPKYAVKDSPKEQFEWAMTFYQAKDYQRASQEFEKLTKQYEYSEYASKAQYYVGLCYENMNKLYIAFQNYQKAIDNFPHIENLDEINAREFNIAGIYEMKMSPKILGTDIMTSLDRSVEIYKKVVENAPFGRLADESQFRMGTALKKAERYDEAIQAFQKILDDYPNSQFFDKSKFELADCAYKASMKPAYDIESTDKAIKAFQDFAEGAKDQKLTGEAGKTIQRLRDRSAEKSYITAQFYEGQGHYESAIIYYKDVVTRFPDTSLVEKSKAKIAELENKISPKKNEAGQSIKTGGWNPFNFPKKPKSQETAVTKDAAKPKSKGWWPFNSAKSEKKEPTVKTEAAKTEKPKSWNPFKFASKPKPKETPKPVEKKGWTPFSFKKQTKPSKTVEAVKEVKAEKPAEEPQAKVPDAASTPAQAEAAPADNTSSH